MPELLIVSAVCCAAAAALLLRMLRPDRIGESALRPVVATAIAVAVTLAVGRATDAGTTEFLIGTAVAVAPVSVLLGAAAEEAVPGRRSVAWSLVLVWAAVVFPTTTIVPALLFARCGSSECRVEDFGGALALLVSSAASALLAWHAPTVSGREGWTRFLLPVLGIWLAVAVWLASLEGVVDDYTPRILLAAVVAPLGGAVAWLLVDVLRRAARHPLRSAADGVAAGLIAIVPGAAGISFPWSLAVGSLAGAAAALVFGARRLAAGGSAGHWALVALTSTAIGYLAPAVSGDTVGFVFSGRIGALVPPVAAFLAVAAFGVVTSAPSWALARRRDPR